MKNFIRNILFFMSMFVLTMHSFMPHKHNISSHETVIFNADFDCDNSLLHTFEHFINQDFGENHLEKFNSNNGLYFDFISTQIAYIQSITFFDLHPKSPNNLCAIIEKHNVYLLVKSLRAPPVNI